MGALTLTSAGSKIDFTGTAGTLTFASFVPSSNILSIANYVGTGSPGGTDQLIFHEDESAALSNFVVQAHCSVATSLLAGPKPRRRRVGRFLTAHFGFAQDNLLHTAHRAVATKDP
jgi:hypothetical protein